LICLLTILQKSSALFAISAVKFPLPERLQDKIVLSLSQRPTFGLGGTTWIAIIAVLATFAILSLLWRRDRASRRLLERRVAELSALGEAGRAIVAAQLDVDELCMLIYRQARQIVDTWVFQLGLFEDDAYHIKVWIRRGERQPEAVFDLQDGEGIVGWIRQAARPLLVQDFETEAESLPARPRYISDDPPRSAVFVPLIANETVIGAMAIQSYRPAAFTEDHQRVLSIIANQAAAAIVNARLYETERRQRQMADTLQQISTLINSSLDVDHVLCGILDGLAQLIAYDAAAILLLNEDHTFTLRAARGLPALEAAVGRYWPLAEGQRLRRLADARQALIFGPEDEQGAYHQLLAFPADHSCLGAPIMVRNELIGVLSVDCRDPGKYREADAALVSALASQAAAALENARLYAAGQEEAWISTALLEVAEATGLAQSVDEVLETVVRITPLLVGVDRCAILLWDQDEQACQVVAAYKLGEDDANLQVGQVIPPGAWSLLDRLWQSGAPVVDEFGAMPGAPSVQDVEITLLALPLRAQGELTGAMVIGFSGQVSFSEHRVKLIAGVANQAALAIESAQLAAAQQEEAWVSLALLQVAEAVANLTDLNDVLAVVTRLTPLLVGVESCLVYLWDAAQQSFLPGAAYGLSHDGANRFQSVPIPASAWPEMLAAKSNHTAGATGSNGGASDETRDAVFFTAGPSGAIVADLGLCCPVALPLLSWREMSGALVIDAPDGDIPSGRRLNILTGVAQQTATAIQNARLYVESIERQKLEREIQLARQIQATFLPDRAPHIAGWDLAAYWQGAREVSGDFYDFIALADPACPGGKWGFVVADVADKGVPAALFMALSRTLIRTVARNGCDPADVLTQANELIVTDARSDLFVTLFYAILDPLQGRLVYANAGHNPPLLFGYGSDQVIELTAKGVVLGVIPDVELEQREVRLAPGDLLLLYTDGVTDALNETTKEFGLQRLCQTIEAHRTQTAAEIIQAVNQAVAEFVGDTAQFDDFTLVVLKRQFPEIP
jgi:serine phosphatase RsbU (regulator of sigma subunit)